MGETVTFASNGGTASGYLARPSSGQGGPGVVVLQEWWGLNDNIKGIADRFAAESITALAPDLYHGTVTAEPDEAGKLLMALDIARAENDLRGAIAYLNAQSGGPVGIVGFCMGGALSLFAACKNGGSVGACVDFYGGHPAVTYDWEGLTGPVLGIWAEHDDFVNPDVPMFERELSARGIPHEFITYPGTHHAFFNDEHPDGVFNREAADDAWRRVLEFFRANLK